VKKQVGNVKKCFALLRYIRLTCPVKMKYLISAIILLALGAIMPQKLIKVKLDDSVTVYIPEDFIPMTPEDMQQRYSSHRRPLALYTDPQRIIDFGVNRSYSVWQEGDLELLKEFYLASIIDLYDTVVLVDSGIRTVNKHEFVFFEFESTVYPENDFQRSVSKYTYLMYGLSGGTTFLFNFTCPRYLKDEWQDTAREMMNRVKLK
jgi:hypothetical protein